MFGAIAESTCIRERDTKNCAPLLLRLNKRFPNIENFAATDRQGNFFASGKPFNIEKPPSVANHPFFKALADGASIYIMDPHTGPVSGVRVTGIVIPLRTADGQFDGLIGTSTKLKELEALWQDIFLQEQVSVLILDRNNSIISQTPDLTMVTQEKGFGETINRQLKQPISPSTITIDGESFNYHTEVSNVSDWRIITLNKKNNPVVNALSKNPGVILLISVFLLLAGFALLMLRREGGFVRHLVSTEEALRQQRDNLETLVDAKTADLAQQERSFRNLFESNEASLWNEDLSEVLFVLDQLKTEGISNLLDYLNANPQAVWEMAKKVKVISVNRATLRLFGAKNEHSFFDQISNTFGANAIEIFKHELCAIWDGKRTFRDEAEFITLDGKTINTIISFPIPKNPEDFKSIPITILDVTERLKVERSLRESEARFRQLFENTPTISVQGYNKNRQVIFWNKASEIIYGYTAEEAIGQQLEDLIIPNHMRDRVISDTNNLITAGVPIPSTELSLRCADGSSVEVFSSHVMFWNQQNEPEMYCIDVNLTEKKKAEAALFQSEVRLREAQKIAKIGSFEQYLSEDAIWCSDELYGLFGITQKAQLPSKHDFTDLLHPDDKEGYIEAIKHTLSTGEPTREEYRAKTKNGEWQYFETIAKVKRDTSGKISALTGTVQDITERIQARKSIQRSERRLRAIIDAVPSMIFIKNAEGRFLAVNKAVADGLGMSVDEIVGKRLGDIYPYPDEVHTMLEDDHRVLESGKELHIAREIYHDRKGTTRWRQMIKVPYSEDQFGEPAVLGIAMDITKLKQTEEALRRTQKMEAVGQLTGGIAHDFNNILGIIIGNLNLLKRHIPDDEKALKRVDTIKQSAQRAVDLTKQLLGFSRRQADQIVITDINKTMGEMDSLIARSVTPEVEVKRKLADDLWLTEIDPGDFQDALLNLILNARDAMPDGGELTLETRNRTLNTTYCAEKEGLEPGEYVELSITDTGEGMPAERQERIFEPFFTTKSQGKGTGLGLAMVFGFVERSGGHIEVYSKEGVGTTFKLYLSRAMSEHSLENEKGSQSKIIPKGHELILVVDDETELLLLVEESLRELGYQVLTAADGKQAKLLLDQEPTIALLFTDVVMPGGVNGYELAELATATHPNLKVLLTSGYTEKAAANMAQSHFNANLLSKPYTLGELAERVRSLLDNKE